MMDTPGSTPRTYTPPAARCNTLDFHGKSCALAEGLVLASRADVYTIRCSCKQWPCTYTAPCKQCLCIYKDHLRCKNLLVRIPNPHIRPALAAPQPTHPAGGNHAQISSTGNRTPSTTRTPTIRPPSGIPDTRSTQPHGSDQTHSRPRWKLSNTRSLTRSVPRQHESPPDYQAGQAFSFA